jgi:hypothetical protein
VYLDESVGIATFPIYSIDRRLVGYQQYNPLGIKSYRRDPKLGKYYTQLSEFSVWGLDFSLDKLKQTKTLVVCEGIFKACRFHNYGIPAVATLTNNPKPLKPFIERCLSQGIEVIVAPDPDAAGNKLRKYGNSVLYSPVPVDEMSEPDFKNLLENCLLLRKFIV